MTATPACYAAPEHPAGHVPGLAAAGVPGTTYLYAFHDGAWRPACAVHSGLCHEACWPDGLYPGLRPRIAPWWLSPGPGEELSGPYDEDAARERWLAGRDAWPLQQVWRGDPARPRPAHPRWARAS